MTELFYTISHDTDTNEYRGELFRRDGTTIYDTPLLPSRHAAVRDVETHANELEHFPILRHVKLLPEHV